jgi:hypothetical protein
MSAAARGLYLRDELARTDFLRRNARWLETDAHFYR